MDKSKICVCLDAGHGVNTPGKCSPDKSLKEWAYTREIVKGIAEKLKALGIEYYIVHPEDQEIKSQSYDLCLRTSRANAKHQTLKLQGRTSIFISVHVNAAGNGGWYKARGWSVWTSKGQTQGDKVATELYKAANEILTPLGQKLRADGLDGDPDYESNFWVLTHTHAPAVLTENMFMDTKEECQWLLSDQGKKAIIDLHVKGILNYIAKF